MFPYHDNNPTTRWPVVTLGLIGINVAIFLWMTALPPGQQARLVIERGFVPARLEQITNPNRVVEVPLIGAEQQPFPGRPPVVPVVRLQPAPREIVASLVSCMFLHGGWMHLLGNMWFLYLFGNNVEDRLGHGLYLLFYLGGGLLATLAHWAYDPASNVPVIGASGAVSAVLGAYAVTYPHARVHTLVFLFFFITVIDLPAYVVLGFWFLGQLLEAYGQLGLDVSGGVAFWAHIGGFVAGAIVMPMLRAVVPPPQPPQDDRWQLAYTGPRRHRPEIR
jgi:membrane associated rhomboid family serine protease